MRAFLPLALLCLSLCSCDDNARGLAISGDGSVFANTPEHQRGKVALRIQADLDEQLGKHWRSHVAIAELPTYDDEDVHAMGDKWSWDKATVTIELVSDGGSDLPQTINSLKDGVWDFMRRRVDHAKRNLTITVTSTVDAARFAALAQPAPAGSPSAGGAQHPVVQMGSSTRHYTVQAKDTLADISSAFYGTPDHWRLIVAANPDLNPAHMAPGTVIVIPPAP